MTIFLINTTFAIPAKPLKLLINKAYKLFEVKPFDKLKLVMPLLETTSEPIKPNNNFKISLKSVINENYKAKLLWVSAIGHQAKRYIIQISHVKEIFFDLKEMEVQTGKDERQLHTFVSGRSHIGTKYYRIILRR